MLYLKSRLFCSGYKALSLQATKLYRPRNITAHKTLQATKLYRPRNSTGHETLQATKHHRPRNSTGHATLQATQLYRPRNSTGHETSQAPKLYRPRNSYLLNIAAHGRKLAYVIYFLQLCPRSGIMSLILCMSAQGTILSHLFSTWLPKIRHCVSYLVHVCPGYDTIMSLI